MMPDRIVITGAAGFIGSALAARHLADGAIVHAIVRPGSQLGRLAPGVAVHPVDLHDRAALHRMLSEIAPTTIYHLATSTGRKPDHAEMPPTAASDSAIAGDDIANLLGLLSIAATLAAPPRRIVRTGSLAEYGDGPTPAREDQRERPRNAYAGAMVAGTHLVSALQPQLPFPVRTARLGLTYGARQSRAFLIPWLIERCLAGEPSLVRAPDQRRDLIHVDDVVAGLMILARTDRAVPVVNLSTGTAPTMRAVARIVARCCGTDPRLIGFGNDDATAPTPAPQIVCGDPALAWARLGWRACCTLDEGLARTIDDVRHERAAA